MEFVMESVIFLIFMIIGMLIVCYCCFSGQKMVIDQERPLPTPESQNISQRTCCGRGNKSDDDPPPIFSLTTSSHMYTNHDMQLEPMDVCDDLSCPPPMYEDALVIKPNPMNLTVVPNKR